jgi:hypothetical protein
MRDSAADIARRAWAPCPRCADRPDWCYLLAAEARFVFVQCDRCHLRWWHDIGFGVGARPRELDRPLTIEVRAA